MTEFWYQHPKQCVLWTDESYLFKLHDIMPQVKLQAHYQRNDKTESVQFVFDIHQRNDVDKIIAYIRTQQPEYVEIQEQRKDFQTDFKARLDALKKKPPPESTELDSSLNDTPIV